jgi:serine/threonine protein kinase
MSLHKDINPGNIVLNPAAGVVKIIDFGIATRLNCKNPTSKSSHILEGTIAYLSPEQTGRFKQATVISPHQYVIQQRVERAKLMLSKTDLAELARRLRRSQTSPYKSASPAKAI